MEQAEQYAQQGLRREEAFARPYCLYVLGQIRRVQSRFGESEDYCRQAIAAAEEIQDLWGLAPSWRALGECLRDAGSHQDAQSAFEKALEIFERLGVEQEVRVMKTLLTTSNSSF